MALTLKYDERYAGAKAVAKAGAQAYSGIVDHGTVYNAGDGNFTYCTGYYYEDGWWQYVQTTNGLYLVVDLNNPDWSFTVGAQKTHAYTQSQAQYLVNKIIKNNYAILCNNLICARYADRLTSEERQLVRDLQERLQARNSALQAEGLVDNIQTATPAGYAELSGSLDALMADERIGIATWVVVVIACAVIAATATAA